MFPLLSFTSLPFSTDLNFVFSGILSVTSISLKSFDAATIILYVNSSPGLAKLLPLLLVAFFSIVSIAFLFTTMKKCVPVWVLHYVYTLTISF